MYFQLDCRCLNAQIWFILKSGKKIVRRGHFKLFFFQKHLIIACDFFNPRVRSIFLWVWNWNSQKFQFLGNTSHPSGQSKTTNLYQVICMIKLIIIGNLDMTIFWTALSSPSNQLWFPPPTHSPVIYPNLSFFDNVN